MFRTPNLLTSFAIRWALILLIGVLFYVYQTSLFLFLNQNLPESLQGVALFFTSMADAFFAVLWLIAYRKKRPGLLVRTFLALILSAIVVQLLKSYFGWPRPPALLGDEVHVLGMKMFSRSFPSGHSATAMVLARYLMAGSSPSLRVLYFMAGVAMAVSRIFVGAHFPIDVFVGGIIGYYITDTLIKGKLKAGPNFDTSRLPDILGLLWIYIYFRFYNEKTTELEAVLTPLAFAFAALFLGRIFFSFKKRGRILFLTVALLCLWQFRWLQYVEHLVYHQITVMLKMEPISKILSKPDIPSETKEKLSIIIRAKELAIREYGIAQSNSYKYYVDLGRPQLGWNLSVAPPFQLKLEQFYFPFVGRFSYLGFFEPQLVRQWKQTYESERYDTCVSEIGGYSTLGILPDPVFSTFLRYSKEQLPGLIFHEMAHEKLYFRNDSTLSEQLAVYVETVMEQKYGDAKPNKRLKKQKALANQLFLQLVSPYKKRLELLYDTRLDWNEKQARKTRLFQKLRATLLQKQKKLRLSSSYRWLVRYPVLNNAILLQVLRYTPTRSSPSSSAGFDEVFQQCNKELACFFQEISTLQNCVSPEQHMLTRDFLSGNRAWAELKKACLKN